MEVLWQLELSIPSVQGHHCLRKFFFHRWKIVGNLEHQVGALVIYSISKVLAGRSLRHCIFLLCPIILEAKAHICQRAITDDFLVVIPRAADQEVGASIEGVRFDIALAGLVTRLGDLVEELSLHDLRIVLLAEHGGQTKHILLEVVEVGRALVLRINPPHLHVERDRLEFVVV